MNKQTKLGDIPVVVEVPKLSQKLHWQRRLFQLSILALFVLIPATGLFRIDPVQGAFMILDRQVWFSDFSIVFGLWIAGACFLAMLYSVAGTVFCGWACPQNTLSEWANLMTFKLLGKRAELSLDGTPMQVAPSKDNVLNWLILVVLCVLAAAALALVPLFYFYSPSVVWSFMTFQYDPALASSLHWIYTVIFLVLLIDITMIRHFMCRFMCIYKVWQHTFRTVHTLHIDYDKTREEECAKCNYCVSSCFLGIDPRKTDLYDTCINCGECITACHNLHARKGEGSSLLKFAMGERASQGNLKTGGMSTLLGRMSWALPIFVLGVSMFFWGLATYERYHISAYRADTLQGSQILDYRISLANKFYETAQITVAIEGLPEGSYQLEKQTVNFETAGRLNVKFSISPDLAPGLYPFLIRAKTADGWEETFRVHHLATK